MSTVPITAPIEQQPASPVAGAARAFGSFIGPWIKWLGGSAIVALAGALIWWVHAISLGGASVFAEPIGFVSGPTVQVDAAHPVPLKSYFGIYLHTKAFDENGNPIIVAPADAEKRLGFWVHYHWCQTNWGRWRSTISSRSERQRRVSTRPGFYATRPRLL